MYTHALGFHDLPEYICMYLRIDCDTGASYIYNAEDLLFENLGHPGAMQSMLGLFRLMTT